MFLSKGQEEAMKALIAGKNVFLTGEAGTGKSHVIKEFLKRKGRRVLVCAPTGIAAINVGGMTLHRAFHLPIYGLKPDITNFEVTGAVKAADTIIIDEISMCRLDVFFAVASIINNLHKRKQLIVVGDFYQLAPFLTPREKENNYFRELWKKVLSSDYTPGDMNEPFSFLTEAWKSFNFRSINLTEQMRQREDLPFLDALNRIRIGDYGAIAWINKHAAPVPHKNSIYLCGRNAKAKEINERNLEQIKGASVAYHATIKGDVRDEDKTVDDTIILKTGCRIMTVVNDTADGLYVNGSLGTVKKTADDYIIVDFDNGNTNVKIERYEWQVLDYKVGTAEITQFRLPRGKTTDGKNRYTKWQDYTEFDELPSEEESDDGVKMIRQLKKKVFNAVPCGTVTQLPVKLAYAVTIHKSQGRTYDSVTLDPDCFGSGQLYVALSRVRRITDLFLERAIHWSDLKTSATVKEFYQRINDESKI